MGFFSGGVKKLRLADAISRSALTSMVMNHDSHDDKGLFEITVL